MISVDLNFWNTVFFIIVSFISLRVTYRLGYRNGVDRVLVEWRDFNDSIREDEQ